MTIPSIGFGGDKKVWLSESLLKLVHEGDCGKARKFFDELFWKGEYLTAEWRHLKVAMMKENHPMMKLLVTWGAKVDENELREMRSFVQYPRYVEALRRCGIRLGLPEPMPVSHETPQKSPDEMLEDAFHRAGIKTIGNISIPKEWLHVLKACQDQGAGEAIIAGGALRDLFNQKEIKDVDIFLLSQGSERKNKKFLKNVFETAGLVIIEQFDGRGDTGIYREFMDPHKGGMGILRSTGYGFSEYAVETEAWKVLVASAEMMRPVEYNIIFLSGLDKRTERVIDKTGGMSFKHDVLDMFDFGVCCIATNGKGLYTTADYDNDVKNKTITLLTENLGSKEHLQRIVKKYPDWTLCDNSKKLLKAPVNPKADFDFY